MGNLGPYEQITTLAKSMGGVDKLLDATRAAAVAEAAPRIAVVSAALGGALALGGRALWVKYRAVQAAGRDAEADLRQEISVADVPSPDRPIPGDQGVDND